MRSLLAHGQCSAVRNGRRRAGTGRGARRPDRPGRPGRDRPPGVCRHTRSISGNDGSSGRTRASRFSPAKNTVASGSSVAVPCRPRETVVLASFAHRAGRRIEHLEVHDLPVPRRCRAVRRRCIRASGSLLARSIPCRRAAAPPWSSRAAAGCRRSSSIAASGP